ncbi:alpha/beta hydrolase [Streptomyces sp. CBMA156]|uniref:alpha/beta hydrolase n=1 Tax=Streptomyces sp. CBMA156 TaxID=1930280 RepID=UPI0016620853|nr:alpha/beta hydrolase [Streptomyces sp. CBMA156]MBD0670435.1 alpha/beta hydrolase [Streptomyces sp. CBMA156]MBD0675200.1 alpha/beta hydrolase [Streptomyces sp. CBMA156]
MTAARTALRRASALTLALTACLATAPTAAASAPASASGGLDRYHHQRLDWHGCAQGPDDADGRALDAAGARCADARVPLDYTDPAGRSITVAISRLKATDTRHRIGSLLINPGGPGNSGLATGLLVRPAMGETGARYDLIGLDPRFTGRSTPLDCGLSHGPGLPSAGPTRAGFERQRAEAKATADACRATNAALLPHVTTRNTARDIDVVRAALGERRISYLGYSYGTYLGTVYTQLFPGRQDRVVLDSALDPRRYNPRLMRGTEDANERALDGWADWTAARHDTYALGRTRAQVLATVGDVLAASARTPLTLGTGPDTFRLDDSQVPALIFTALGSDTDGAHAALAEQVSLLARAAEGHPTALPPAVAAVLRTGFTPAGSPGASAQTAILCGDAPAPRDPEQYWRDIEADRAAHPLFGPMTENITPCAFWDRPREEPTEVRRDAPALIVAATGDPRTPYTGAAALHTLLPSSRLLTLAGAAQHADYAVYGNACVDTAVNAYLATGRLPARDLTCAK